MLAFLCFIFFCAFSRSTIGQSLPHTVWFAFSYLFHTYYSTGRQLDHSINTGSQRSNPISPITSPLFPVSHIDSLLQRWKGGEGGIWHPCFYWSGYWAQELGCHITAIQDVGKAILQVMCAVLIVIKTEMEQKLYITWVLLQLESLEGLSYKGGCID